MSVNWVRTIAIGGRCVGDVMGLPGLSVDELPCVRTRLTGSSVHVIQGSLETVSHVRVNKINILYI